MYYFLKGKQNPLKMMLNLEINGFKASGHSQLGGTYGQASSADADR
jgi:hypothetical protein